MDSSTWQLFAAAGLITALAVVAMLAARRDRKMQAGDIDPRPRSNPAAISRRERRERDAFVIAQVNDLGQLPWGERVVPNRQEAERIYQGALDALDNAEGDYRKYVPVVNDLLHCPLDLALSGLAAVVLKLAYVSNQEFTPRGVQAALAFTSAAIKHDPLSADAWIMRLRVASSVPDSRYHQIAKAALKQVRLLDPNHPRFPDAEAQFYYRHGPKEAYKAALPRMIDLAPSPVVKRAGYDRLAMYSARQGQLDDALATYQRHFREQPEGSAWTWHNHSILLMAADRNQEALDASNRALAFFEFGVARDINNEARQALGLPPSVPTVEVDG